MRDATRSCDVLVIGSGAGGLSTAITARKAGLDVVIIEKEEFFGGTTAFSGGVLWIPGNAHARKTGIADSPEAARTYLRHEGSPGQVRLAKVRRRDVAGKTQRGHVTYSRPTTI